MKSCSPRIEWRVEGGLQSQEFPAHTPSCTASRQLVCSSRHVETLKGRFGMNYAAGRERLSLFALADAPTQVHVVEPEQTVNGRNIQDKVLSSIRKKEKSRGKKPGLLSFFRD